MVARSVQHLFHRQRHGLQLRKKLIQQPARERPEKPVVNFGWCNELHVLFPQSRGKSTRLSQPPAPGGRLQVMAYKRQSKLISMNSTRFVPIDGATARLRGIERL